jgi:hypothetical protein
MNSSAEVISPDYVIAEQLATELGVTERTLLRWRKTRTGPPVTAIGRTIYYRRQAIKEWLLAREGNSSRLDRRLLLEAHSQPRNARRHNPRRTAKR